MEKLSKVLIANRGEVVDRIARTLREMGKQSVAVFTEADRGKPFINSTDEAVLIRGRDNHSGYMDQDALIEAAKLMGADAIHPGFGFLSENASFARNVRKNDLKFIGPSEESIQGMGDKLCAKRTAMQANVSTIPGIDEPVSGVRRALDVVNKIGGYPVIVKAAAGGGGKGIRVARSAEELEEMFGLAVSEASSSFSNGDVFIEKFIDNPHHIEIQVAADKHGNVVCLGERECSIQRRYQKIVEETPSVLIDDETRSRMYAQCVSLVRRMNYYSVGTVEFVVNSSREFFFLEMNTRLQVEHTITEMVTGIDLVEVMVNVEEGYPLDFTQDSVRFSGAAIEARIYAEDPDNDFAPSVGRITDYIEPLGMEGIRIETGVLAGSDISPHYDPMIVKLCAHGEDRQGAISTLSRALSEFIIYGRDIVTNMVSLEFILRNKRFLEGDTCTDFVATECSSNKYSSPDVHSRNVMLSALAHRFVASEHHGHFPVALMAKSAGFSVIIRYEASDALSFSVTIDDWCMHFSVAESSKLRMIMLNSDGCRLCVKVRNPKTDLGDMSYYASFGGHHLNCRIFDEHVGELFKFMPLPKSREDDSRFVVSQLSGMVVDVFVAPKSEVKKGERILCVEAMKMQNILYAKTNAIVEEVKVVNGTLVNKGDVLVVLEPC